MYLNYSGITKVYKHVDTLQSKPINLERWGGLLPHWEVWQVEFWGDAKTATPQCTCWVQLLLSVRRNCKYDITLVSRLHFMAQGRYFEGVTTVSSQLTWVNLEGDDPRWARPNQASLSKRVSWLEAEEIKETSTLWKKVNNHIGNVYVGGPRPASRNWE